MSLSEEHQIKVNNFIKAIKNNAANKSDEKLESFLDLLCDEIMKE